MASTSAVIESQPSPCSDWPRPLRWAGVFAALALLLPLPSLNWGTAFKGGIRALASNSNDLVPGFGAATRWLIGDVRYASAVKARERGDWDAALTDHLAALAWAPTRMGNWLGFGETALEASGKAKIQPRAWYQYGQIAYSRAERMEPANGFLFYGEAKLLTSAVKQGGMMYAQTAEKDFQYAIGMYPNLPSLRYDYGTFLETLKRDEEALVQYRMAERLAPGDSAAKESVRRLSSSPHPP
jgi:tetratricopeptide (TPR) repeat protein